MRVHFVGVGGYGMSALAELLLRRGVDVSGCDARPNQRSDRLAALGARIWAGHDVSHLEGVDRVVYSTDVPTDLPEMAEADRLGVERVHRSQILAEAMAGAYAVAVTGTHGKTTTTALTTHLLAAAGQDPVGVVGGEIDAWGGGVRVGRGGVVVAEADESDGSFLRYRPDVAIVTNIEPEHLEHYGGDFARVLAAYGRFLSQVAPGGAAILWRGDPRLRRLGEEAGARVRWYGLEADADVRAEGVEAAAGGMAFDVVRDGKNLGRVRLAAPGAHNVLNALAAIEAGLAAGAAWDAIAPALAEFRNAHRRFEVVYRGPQGVVVDDYAHHPSEIRAVLAAARALGHERVCAVFQPQRYVRTRNLWPEFVEAFDDADSLVVLDVYAPAGEAPIPGVSGEALAQAIARRHPHVRYARSLDAAADMAVEAWRPGDLWLTMGAGDVWRVARELGARLCGTAGSTVSGTGA